MCGVLLQYVRWLLYNRYTDKPDGMPGNDDYGTMSAWFVWGSLGLYPLTGTKVYFVGSPAVDKAVIRLPKGQLTITSYNNSNVNTKVEKAVVNNRTIDLINSPFIDHSEISNGGMLQFWMHSE
jgi:putative alpha-1,2-mannosidase